MSPTWPATLQPLALVASPRLGLRHTCFEQAVGNPKWDNAMDEEMAALDVNAT